AIEEPVRPARRKPIITGPISFVMARPTMGPSTAWLTLRSWSADWTTSTMPTKSDSVAAIGAVSVPIRTSCATIRWRSVAPKRSWRQAAAKRRMPSPISWSIDRMAAPVRAVTPERSVSASAATRRLDGRIGVDEPRRPEPAALPTREAPEEIPVEPARGARVPAKHAPQRRPHREDAAVRGEQAVHERRDLSGGTAVVRVAAQQSDDGVEVAGLPGVLVALPLVAPEDEEAVAAMEVEVLVVLIGGAVERPQPERRADAVAVAAAVDGRQAPDAPGLLAETPLAEDQRPRT